MLIVPANDGSGNYQWKIVEFVAIVLLIVMVLQVLALLSVTIWLWNRETGLRWDMESIANLVVLIKHSNVWKDIRELSADEASCPRHLRLGYWRKGDEIVHTIGTNGLIYHSGTVNPASSGAGTDYLDPDMTPTQDFSEPLDREARFRHSSWFVTRQARIFLSLVCVITAGAIVIMTSRSRIAEKGFPPLVS